MSVNTIGGRIDVSNLHRDVWKHAVAATFPTKTASDDRIGVDIQPTTVSRSPP